MRQFIFLSFFVILLCSGCSPLYRSVHQFAEPSAIQPDDKPQATTLISQHLLQEDLVDLKQKLLAIHPQPFTRISEKTFEQLFESSKNSLGYPMSVNQFYTRIAPLLSSLQDTHSFVRLPRQASGQHDLTSSSLFPLAVLIEGKQMLVATDLSEQPQVPAGAELLTINHAKVVDLISAMARITSHETETGKSRKIQMDFPGLLSVMGFAAPNYRLTYQYRKEVFTLDLPGLKHLPLDANQSDQAQSHYGFSLLTAKTALLWLNDFDESPEAFTDFLSEKFALLQRLEISNLIIDLRYNHGGLLENMQALLARLARQNLAWTGKVELKVSEALKKHHRHKTKVRRKNKFHVGWNWLPLEWTDQLQHQIWWGNEGELLAIAVSEIEAQTNYKPQNNWVLTNGYCYSACSQFVALVNHYQLAKTLGEKTGSLVTPLFAYPLSFELPHSKLRVTLPTLKLDFIKTNLADPIAPQETLERSQSDIENRRDPVMAKALQEAENR